MIIADKIVIGIGIAIAVAIEINLPADADDCDCDPDTDTGTERYSLAATVCLLVTRLAYARIPDIQMKSRTCVLWEQRACAKMKPLLRL